MSDERPRIPHPMQLVAGQKNVPALLIWAVTSARQGK